MNTQPSIETRLWDYIDGLSSPEEKSAIEQLIESNIEWRRQYHELLEVHQLMSNSLELDEPSMRFTQNVMEDIAKYQIAPAAKNYINKRVIWGIGAFFLITIVGFLVFVFGQMLTAPAATGGGTNALPFNIDPNKLNVGNVLNSTSTNVFLVINAILGLVLLDMYLGRKKKQLREQL
ncbi:anti-sigma factor family protein [Paraflavitalea pollutisoli]|uniref:anti-sigma factor family protein n=1 Tax=Paraflavitalea pollutisoli TaxID=3034143 RepID=UPI0023EDC493|nr:hypothetical protein [Paraflavitalea sp. H1-2-19X]